MVNDSTPMRTPRSNWRISAFEPGRATRDSFVQVQDADRSKWLPRKDEICGEIPKEIDQDLQPRSFALSNSRIDLDWMWSARRKRCIMSRAILPGTTDEYVVIGAHYDHLGLGDEFRWRHRRLGRSIQARTITLPAPRG